MSDEPVGIGPNDPVVIVTGAAGNLGRRLTRRLHRDCAVVGIDRRPFPQRPKDVALEQIDIRRNRAENVFRRWAGRIQAVFHTGILHDMRKPASEHYSFNLVGTTQVMNFCVRYKVPKVVFLSSANVYGPLPGNAQFLTEDAPLRGSEGFPMIRDLVAVDHAVSSFLWKHPELETVILRPVHIVGGVKNAPSNYLRLKYVPTLLGFDPMVQIIHVEDVVDAMVMAAQPGLRGIFNLTGPGEVPLSAILKELGKVAIPVPHPIARPLLRFLWNSRLTTFPEPELDHIQYICMVDGTRARDVLGFTAKRDLRETMHAAMDAGPLSIPRLRSS
jgi:UDP-glucose 4-epimerase